MQMKKSIIITLLVIVFINALLPNFIYATNKNTVNQFQDSGSVTGGSTQKDDHGNLISQSQDRSTAVKSSQGSYAAAVIGQLIGSLPYLASKAMGEMVDAEEVFTVEDLLFGEYDLFDINFFKIEDGNKSEMNTLMKKGVAGAYSMVRTISIIGSLATLIYIGIRMAISATVEEKTRYKSMFLNWIKGFALLFVLHYLIIFLLYTSNTMVDLLSIARPQEIGFEKYVVEQVFQETYKGWEFLMVAVIYFILVWYQVKFFYIYFRRFISTGFLLIISPLVTMFYPLDAGSDGKSSSFKSFMKECITTIFIQPLHGLLYLVFLYSAMEICKVAPIVALLFLFGLSRAEKMLKQIFNMEGKTIRSMSDIMKFQTGKGN